MIAYYISYVMHKKGGCRGLELLNVFFFLVEKWVWMIKMWLVSNGNHYISHVTNKKGGCRGLELLNVFFFSWEMSLND